MRIQGSSVVQLHAGILGYTLAGSERVIDGDDDRSTVQKKRVRAAIGALSALPLPNVRKPPSKTPTVFPLDQPARSCVVLKRAKFPAREPASHTSPAKQGFIKVAWFLRCIKVVCCFVVRKSVRKKSS
jgi:hypothetical protein